VCVENLEGYDRIAQYYFRPGGTIVKLTGEEVIVTTTLIVT
jgi:hypothetical protein